MHPPTDDESNTAKSGPGADVPVDEVLDADNLEQRSEIARFLNPSLFPATGDELLKSAIDNFATGSVLAILRALPGDKQFENVQAVWEAVGGETEERF